MAPTKEEGKREWLVVTKQGNFVVEASPEMVQLMKTGDVLIIRGDDGVIAMFQEWTAFVDVGAVKRCELPKT